MGVKTTKHWSNYLQLLLLVTVFLTMQWAPAHIHLNEYHDHGSIHHQHQTETHTHKTIDEHVLDQISHANVIVLDHECCFPKLEKQTNISTALVTKVVSVLQPLMLTSINFPAFSNSKLSYFDLSVVNPRAPPIFS